jgi:hypothetical protein
MEVGRSEKVTATKSGQDGGFTPFHVGYVNTFDMLKAQQTRFCLAKA